MKPLALVSILFITAGCASPPKRLAVEESRLLSTEFEYAKRYDNLLTILQEELSAIDKERKFYREEKGEKSYPGDLEGKLFILDDIAEIYTSGLVDFQKGFETNENALEVYNEIQKVGVQNIPDSPYFNPRRRLYYYFYPNGAPAKLVDPSKPHGEQAVGVEQIANRLTGEIARLGQMPYVSPFTKEYLMFVRQKDLQGIRARIDKRFELLSERLELRSPETLPGRGVAPAISGISNAQEFTIVRDALEKAGVYNAYYLNFYLTGKAWALRTDWGGEAYENVVYFGRRAIDHVAAGRPPDEYESLAFLRYWVGMAELKRGNVNEGVEQLQELVRVIAVNDRILNEQATALATKISSLRTQRTVATTVGLILSLAAAASGAGSSPATQLAGETLKMGGDMLLLLLSPGISPWAGVAGLFRLDDAFQKILKFRSIYAIKLNRFLDQHEQLDYFNGLGRAYEQLGLDEQAVKHYKEAIAIIETQRATIGAEAQRIRFLEERCVPYERIVPLLIRLGRPDEALEFVERARSRAFIDILGSGDLVLATKEDSEAYRQLVRRQSEIDAILGQRAVGVAQYHHLLTRDATGQGAGSQEPRIEIRSLANVTAATAAELLQLVGPEAALVEYFLTESGLAVFIVQDGTIEARLLPLERDRLFSRLRAFRDWIEAPTSPSEMTASGAGSTLPLPDNLALAQELYGILFAPIAGSISKDRLYLVPHGPLHYIPFQALHDGTRYVAERFAVAYLPSATVLKFLKEKQGRPSRGMGPLILANPDLGDPRYDLPSAEREADLIRGAYPAAQVYARSDATKARATELAGHFGLLHFATHGTFNVEHPLDSSLVFAKNGEGQARLTAREIFALRLNASLVVLSACNTGLSRVSTGDELVGLSRAFISAGTPNLVASLWEVADDSTALLMGEFYKNLKSMPKAEALRQAQLTVMRAEIPLSGVRRTPVTPASTKQTIQTSHPYFWAPFIMIGAGY